MGDFSTCTYIPTMSQLLHSYPIPFTSSQVPQELISCVQRISEYDTTSFEKGLDKRDIFLGDPRCVICGDRPVTHCHIIGRHNFTTVRRVCSRTHVHS